MLRQSISRVFLVMLYCALYLHSTAQELDIYHFYVGNGDATLIVTYYPSRNPAIPGANVQKTVLVDGGYYTYKKQEVGSLMIKYITQTLGINKIDYMIASHYDEDHVQGLSKILEDNTNNNPALTIEAIYDRGDKINSGKGAGGKQAYIKAVTAYCNMKHIQRNTLQPGVAFTLCDKDPAFKIIMSCVCVNGYVLNKHNETVKVIQTTSPNENDLSTGFLITYGKFSYLTCGDIGGYKTSSYQDMETSVISSWGPVSAYKVNHHGSGNSSNDKWVKGAAAAVAIISASNSNNYGHPSAPVVGNNGAIGDIANGRLNQVYDDRNKMQNYYVTYKENKLNRQFGANTIGILNPDDTKPIILKVERSFKSPIDSRKVTINQQCLFTVMSNQYYWDNGKWYSIINP